MQKIIGYMKRLYLLLILSIVGFISISAQTTAEKMTLIKDYLAENATKFLTVKGIELKPNMEMKYLLNEVEKKRMASFRSFQRSI